MRYKGDSIVLTGTDSQRDPYLAWTYTLNYEGITSAAVALANAQPAGIVVDAQQNGATMRVSLQAPPDVFIDRWEVDRELLDKDLLTASAFIGLSKNGQAEIKRWRANPDTLLFVAVGSDNPNFPAGNQLSAGDPALMAAAQELILRGAESQQTSTLILKRTRKMSVNVAPSLNLSEKTSFYTTAKLLALEGNASAQVGALPTVPYAPPTNAQWGWLPRNQNRSYISRGFVEEHSDWVFAAWSTSLYTYVA